jgi:hypothetical protein
VPIGATIEKTRMRTWRPISVRRTRKNRREAAQFPDIDTSPLRGFVDPSPDPLRARLVAIATG